MRKSILLSSILALSATDLLAEESTEETYKLDDVVVVANRLPMSQSQVAGTIQTISQEDIALQANTGRKTADILADLVPILGSSSQTTSNYGQTMRGRQIQVLIDGVPQTGSRDAARQLNSISPDMIEKIEVLSGATSVYGSGATGGIISITTKRASKEPLAFRSKVGLSSQKKFNKDGFGYQASQSVSFNEGGFSGFLGADFTKRGEFQNTDGLRISPEPAQTDRQDTQTVNITGQLGYQFNKTRKLNFSANYYDDKQDSDYGVDYGPRLSALFNPAYEPSNLAVKGLNLTVQPLTKKKAFSLQYQDADVFGQSLSVEAYYRDEKSRFFPFPYPFAPVTAAKLYELGMLSKAQYVNLLTRKPDASIPASLVAGIRNSYDILQSQYEVEVYGVRSAIQSELSLLDRPLTMTYGLDYEQENDRQFADEYSLSKFISSNGLNYESTNKSYGYGPNVTIKKLGVFLQSSYHLTPDFIVKGGVRYEQIKSLSDAFTPTSELVVSNYLKGFRIPYSPKTIEKGDVEHSQVLWNLGGVYSITPEHQVYANFSQGFSLPDMIRTLRDVQPGFKITSETVDPIKVNNYELGWRFRGANNGLDINTSLFYNDSDKVTQFKKDFSVSVADTKERVYGFEGSIRKDFYPNWGIGGSLAYTRGQYKDAANNWIELNSYRVAPMKTTIFGQWQSDEKTTLRLQATHIKGSNIAYEQSKEAVASKGVNKQSAAKIKGFIVTDLLGSLALSSRNKINFGIYNLLNAKYKTVYSQEAEAIYGKLSSNDALGRNYSLSYEHNF